MSLIDLSDKICPLRFCQTNMDQTFFFLLYSKLYHSAEVNLCSNSNYAANGKHFWKGSGIKFSMLKTSYIIMILLSHSLIVVFLFLITGIAT